MSLPQQTAPAVDGSRATGRAAVWGRGALWTSSVLLPALVLVLTGSLLPARSADAIPPFARRYQVSCQTCHVIVPKLNTFGEAFRLNGYRIPLADDLYVRDEPLELGAEPWRDLFPDAIWPSNLPGLPPIALRITADVQATWSDAGIGGNSETRWSFEFPVGVQLLSGGRMGDSLGFFAEMAWGQGSGAFIEQAYMVFNPADPVGIRIGAFDPQLLFGHASGTRVGRNQPLWGSRRMADWGIGGLTRSPNRFRLHDSQAGVEVSGIVDRRLSLGAGLVNGNGVARVDQNNHKDIYAKAKWKLFGRDLYGTTPDQETPVVGAPVSGGWVDDSVLLEAFAYRGAWSEAGLQDDFRYAGLSARVLLRDLDFAAGIVAGKHDNPWFTAPATATTGRTWFARAEYMFYPWLLGRVAYSDMDWEEPVGTVIGPGIDGSLDQTWLLFGPVAAWRANIRLALEMEYYLRHAAAEANGFSMPHNLWLRLDYAF